MQLHLDVQDNIVDLLDLKPPFKDVSHKQLAELKRVPLVPVEVYGDRQYYLSLRFGIFLDRATFTKIMTGNYNAVEGQGITR